MEASLPVQTALPTLKNSVEHMTQTQLRTFIPQILRLKYGDKDMPFVYDQQQKPIWWPQSVPFSSISSIKRDSKYDTDKSSWTQELQSVVRNCYRFYGQEHLLKGENITSDNDGSIKVVNNQDGSVSFIIDETVVTLEDRQNTQYASSPATEAVIPGRSLSACTGLQPMPTGLFKSKHAPTTTTITEARDKPFVEVFMCFYCEKQFHQRETLKQHQKYDCVLRPPEPSQQSAYRTRRSTQAATTSQPRSRPLEVVKVIPRKPLRLVEEAVVFPAKGVYIESLDLLPQAKAERVRRQSLGKKINCSVIEVEASRPAKTPATPRTPKSLISQLSRDASPPGRVRLLSRDGSPPSARTKLRMSDCEEEAEGRGQKEGGSDNESECSKSENGEDKYRPRRVATLLNIDLSSPLGGRVNKHISEYYDNNESDSADDDDQSESLVNNTYEDFCRTPTKSNDTGRLRSRGDFQVTFKKTKRTAAKFAHQYKFRRAELSEFCRVVETGLNRRSRALKREMKKCRIMVERLSEADITRWGSSSKQMSRQKHADVQRWVSGCDSSSSASFGQFDYLRSLLTRDTVPRVDHRSKEHYVYQTMRQNIGGARVASGGARMVSGGARVASSAADLTPPHTPEALPGLDDDDVIMLDDMSSPHAPPPTCPTTPQKQPRKTPLTPRKWVDDGDTRLDDVISISSTESDNELKVISPECLKRAANFSPAGGELPVKHRRIEALRPAALLFRCHLCYQEITCHDGANIYIKQHFAASHNVYNIDLIEHLDAVGQKVVSIVEVPIPSAVQVAGPPTTLKVDPTPQPRATQFKSAAGKVTKTAPTKTVAGKTSKPTILKAANKPGSNDVKSSKQKAGQVKPVVAARKVTSTKANKPQPKAKVQAKKAAGAKSPHLQNKSTSKTIANNTATATSKSQPKGSAKKLQTVQSNNSKSPVAKNGSKSKIVKRASSASTKTGCLLKVKLKVKPVKRR